MEITNELLVDVEHYASLMFSKKEIAIIIEMDEKVFADLLQDDKGPVFKAFTRGRLKKEALIRKSVFELAQNGSSPAQTFAIKLIQNAKMDDK